MAQESGEYKELDKNYEDELEELLNQAGGNFKNHPELKIKDLRNQYTKPVFREDEVLRKSLEKNRLEKNSPAVKI
ncbi:MAG: hypothetical protein IJT40_03935 [Firmicutes bacterium]|nr:hypothetical protein [Bacillota bacterium]